MKYLAVLGREPAISLAELSALFSDVKQISDRLATLAGPVPNINKLGGSLKLAVQLDSSPLEYLRSLPDGKLTIGVSDYSKNASKKSATTEALKLKKILVRHGRSVRVVENKDATLSTATSLHNGLSGKNDRKVELIKVNSDWYRVIGVQDIDAYAKRDQARPARDAKVGMLPPKLAQILINLCGPLPEGSTILDPFCGTGVVLQEALLMGYRAYGTDISEKMVAYSEKNLKWLASIRIANVEEHKDKISDFVAEGAKRCDKIKLSHREASETCDSYTHDLFRIAIGDATSFHWSQPIDAVACEGYLGQPMSQIPSEIKLKEQQQECSTIILGFLKNLTPQIKPNTPIVIAAPAWLRQDSTYSRLKILDEINDMGYNVSKTSRDGLLYHRENQIVARDIIILRKK